jgi:hypothetical protein
VSERSINKALDLNGYLGKATGYEFSHIMNRFDSAWIEMRVAHVDKTSIKGLIILRNIYLSEKKCSICIVTLYMS